jgi:hypothetical protein
LTEEAGGLGAVFWQEGQRGKKTARLGTYRKQLWFCESVKRGAEEALQEKVLFQERRSARGAKRGNRFNSSSENGSFKHLMSRAFGAHCTNGSNASRKMLEVDPEFRTAFLQAKERVRNMELRYVEVSDPLRQMLLEIYVGVVLKTPYNDFDTH